MVFAIFAKMARKSYKTRCLRWAQICTRQNFDLCTHTRALRRWPKNYILLANMYRHGTKRSKNFFFFLMAAKPQDTQKEEREKKRKKRHKAGTEPGTPGRQRGVQTTGPRQHAVTSRSRTGRSELPAAGARRGRGGLGQVERHNAGTEPGTPRSSARKKKRKNLRGNFFHIFRAGRIRAKPKVFMGSAAPDRQRSQRTQKNKTEQQNRTTRK